MMKLEQFEQLTQPTQLLCAEEDPQWPPEFLDDVKKVWLCRLQCLDASEAILSFESFECLVRHVLCIVLDVLLLLIAGAGG